jgi:hypothetical protein
MAMLKHVGRMANNQRKVIVAYRTVPGDSDSAIVVTTENLEAADHDSLMKLVESNSGQTAEELADVMARSRLSDGSNMLARLHKTGKMVKVLTKDVEMTPDLKTTIMLNELNVIIAQQKGISIDDLAVKDKTSRTQSVASVNEIPEPVADTQAETLQAPQDGVLSDDQIAAQYRSQADRLSKEAAALRRQAEELVPTKKPTAKKKTSKSGA